MWPSTILKKEEETYEIYKTYRNTKNTKLIYKFKEIYIFEKQEEEEHYETLKVRKHVFVIFSAR